MSSAWPIESVAAVAQVVAGQSPKSEFYNYEGQGEPFYQGKKEFGDRFIGPPTTWTTSAHRIAEAGDILMSVRAPVGPVNIAKQRICIGRGLAAIRSGPRVDRDYLYYALLERQPEIRGTEGAVFASINQTQIGAVKIPVPPLAAQKRIVAILDEAFEAIEQVEGLTSNAIGLVGKLGEAGQRALVDSLRAKYKSTKLEAVCSRITVGHVGSMKTRYVDRGIPFLRSTNIKPFRISMDDLVFIDDAFHAELSKSTLTPGTIAVVRTGEPGVAAVIPEDLPVANCSDLVIIHPGPGLCPEYVCVVLNSAFGKALVGARLVGAAQKHFNVTEARRIELPLPPIELQLEIAEKAKRERELAESRIALYQQRLQLLDTLRTSILAAAFRGELLAEDGASTALAGAFS